MADQLTVVMLVFVPLAIVLIFLYSIGYHNFGKKFDTHDLPGNPPHGGVEPMYARFFAYLSLFAAGMLTLVVADNLLLLFVGWEVMGYCSYSLIGFWYGRQYDDPKATPPRKAAIKAFMTTRVADVFMMLGIVYLYSQTGTLNFHDIFFNPEVMKHLLETPSLIGGFAAAHLIGLLLFIGTVGKSAQFPLHVWLPDAMEGPTPVSAMIHAAAMVSAGIYMIARMFPVLAIEMGGYVTHAAESAGHAVHTGNPTLSIMAFIGAFTALFAATIAVAQKDVKKVLAYSTISQLGFMVAVAGLGGYVAVIFHLLTHAFFKALLFLSSGSVIHGMEHGHHHLHEHGHGHDDHGHDAHAHHHEEKPFDPQDMRFMGNLRSKMPVTFWVYLIGSLALAGIFPLAGFWSKDEILADAFQKGLEGAWHAWLVYGLLTIGALFTAFYMTRQVMLVFFGKARHEAAKHAHESAPVMLIPLIVLAVLSVFGGMLNLPGGIQGVEGVHLPLSEGLVNWLGHTQIDYTQRPDLLAPAEMDAHSTHGETTDAHAPAEGTHATEGETATGHTAEGGEHEGGHHAWYHGLDLNPMVAGLSTLIGLLAIFAGYSLYKNGLASAFAPDPLKKIIGVGLFTFLENKWYVDEFYAWLIINPFKNLSVWLAEVIDWDFFHDLFHDGIIASGFAGIANLLAGPVDKGFVDKVFDGAAGMVRGIGGWGTRTFQTGYVRNYALSVLFGVVLLLAYAVYALLT